MNAKIILVRMAVHVSIPPPEVIHVTVLKDTQGIDVRRVRLRTVFKIQL